jgi:hypothetical protein
MIATAFALGLSACLAMIALGIVPIRPKTIALLFAALVALAVLLHFVAP